MNIDEEIDVVIDTISDLNWKKKYNNKEVLKCDVLIKSLTEQLKTLEELKR